jgi:prepilin-type N-terminal cleavage/methylation domain-containing protein
LNEPPAQLETHEVRVASRWTNARKNGRSESRAPATRLRARGGFTLIEMMLVLVIVGILAALMVEHIEEVKDHAYTATMESDLNNLEAAEESYFVDFDTYTGSLPVDRFMPSDNDTFTIVSASITGWSGTVSRLNATGLAVTTCHIAVGTAETTGTEWPGAPYCP